MMRREAFLVSDTALRERDTAQLVVVPRIFDDSSQLFALFLFLRRAAKCADRLSCRRGQ